MSKVFFLNNVYPTAENPRLGSYSRTMAEEIRAAGHEVTVDAMFYHKTGISGKDKLLSYPGFWLRLRRLDLSGYDIVYINHFTYCWPILFNPTLKKAGKTYIHWHGKELVQGSRFNRFLVSKLGKRLTRFLHIAPSEFFKRKILAATPISADTISVSPSGGVDTELFSPDDTPHASGKLIIGFPGEIKTTKGADVLLEIMKRHEDIRRSTGRTPVFRFIAYGPELDEYTAKFRATGAELDIIGKMSKEEMPGFFRGLDIALVLSSAVIGESLGLVALEAMSCAVPVIAHDICAFPEFIIPGKSGELAPYSDSVDARADAVCNAIAKIAAAPDSYTPRDVVMQQYSAQAVIKQYKTL